VRKQRLLFAVAILIVALLISGQGFASTGDLYSEPYASLDLGGMTSEEKLEEFLLTADVVKIEDIGEGITKPRRVTLRKGNMECRAIFKTIDTTDIDVAFTNRFETVFSDRWAYEVAAYRIDRLLGIGLVPVTVTREVDGEIGSLQFWIEDAMKIQDAYDQDLPVGNMDLLLQRLMLMYILDAMIYNIDRNFTNILIRPGRAGFFLIDHSRAFRYSKKLPALKEERNIPVPDRVARGLHTLDLETLQSELGRLLSKRQIRAIEKRRQLLLSELDERGVMPDIG
jgi:hypothetical protein